MAGVVEEDVSWMNFWKVTVDCHREGVFNKLVTRAFILAAPDVSAAWEAARRHAEDTAETGGWTWTEFDVREVASVKLPLELNA